MRKIIFFTLFCFATLLNAQFVVEKNDGSIVDFDGELRYSKDGDSDSWSIGQVYDASLDLSLIKRIYVQEKIATGKISFFPNGGEGTMNAVTGLENGEKVMLPPNTFTREGYRFVGWATSASGDVEYQDKSPVFWYYENYNSELFAVWENEEQAIKISFDANGGDGTMEPIYLKVGQTISIPSNSFTPPSDKEDYVCSAYDTSPDGYAKYKVGGTGRFNESCTLYAFWTPPTDPSQGGASEKFKGQTVFVEGVNIQPEDWVKVSERPEKYFAEWKSGCGWYDTDQSWLNFCWAASASNVIHWWLDRNKEYVDRYSKEHTPWPDMSYNGKGSSSVFKIFTGAWTENYGGFTNIGFNWFINLDNTELVQESAKGKGGFFKDVFGDNILSETLFTFNRRTFNRFVSKALEAGNLVSIGERNGAGGHAITCWGFEFDEEGYVCAVYYTDSATPWNNAQLNRDLSLGKISIEYDEKWVPYMATSILMGDEVVNGRVDINKVWSFSQGKEYWKAYYNEQ